MGGSLSLAVLGAITAAETSRSLLEGQTTPDAFVDGFQIIMLVSAGVGLVGAAVAATVIAKGVPAAPGAVVPAPAHAGAAPAAAAPSVAPQPQRSGGWAIAVPESAGKSVLDAGPARSRRWPPASSR